MKIGNFLVPEIRLEELLVSTLSKIYGMSKTDPIPSKILSDSLGYKYGTEPTFFKKINSMIAYGILEGRGVYNITKLGVELLYPESSEMEKRLKTKSILNVGLWKALFEKHGKNPPKDGLWVSIKNIADVEPVTAKEYENRIYSWYMQDIALVSEEYLDQKPILYEESKTTTSKEPQTLSSTTSKNDMMMSQSVIEVPSKSLGRFILPNIGYVDVTDEDTLEIAKSYLKVLEKKIKSKVNQDIVSIDITGDATTAIND